MIEIIKNLYIGDDSDCSGPYENMAIIHACKTCHQKGVGYHGNLTSDHPNYLIFERDEHLYLNMVDMKREFLPKFTHPIMKSSLSFIDKYIAPKPILIHCNQGLSRSSSIGLVYLARENEISSTSYNDAKAGFLIKYPMYNAGRGIELYLQKNWLELMRM
jgi:Dual specificity phosphatase, catalytic domain